MKQRKKYKHNFYYIFWGTATVSVLFGQLYVGTGYRMMSSSINNIIDSIELVISSEGIY
jgi:hypothetical protein